ncbi:hypothetical protein AAC387_Pa07g3557 [Persea americana]
MSGGVEGSSAACPQRPPQPPHILRSLKRHFPFSFLARPPHPHLPAFDPKTGFQSNENPMVDQKAAIPSFSKLTNKTESCNAESGAPTNERYREATTSTAPTSVSGAGGKRPGRAKVSKTKRTKSVPNIPGSDSGFPDNALNTPGSCRYDSSLGLLTKKFISLIQQAEDATLDLNKAADILEVQKRRIYDITNVLEGIGLIEKTLKNRIRWKGFDTSTPRELEEQVSRLKAEVETLYVQDWRLDDKIREVQENLRALSEEKNSQKWLYVTREDIKNLPCFQNQTVFVIKAPHATTLEVPDPDEDFDYPQQRYQMLLRSAIGPIDCYLVSEHGERLDVNNDPPSSTDLSVENPENTSNKNANTLVPTVQDSGTESEAGQGQDRQKLCSDSTNSQDIPGILKIVPSNEDNGTDYWLLSDLGFSISDMWKSDQNGPNLVCTPEN